jgi:hypothetical protein
MSRLLNAQQINAQFGGLGSEVAEEMQGQSI